jgi:hypothetical protein
MGKNGQLSDFVEQKIKRHIQRKRRKVRVCQITSHPAQHHSPFLFSKRASIEEKTPTESKQYLNLRHPPLQMTTRKKVTSPYASSLSIRSTLKQFKAARTDVKVYFSDVNPRAKLIIKLRRAEIFRVINAQIAQLTQLRGASTVGCARAALRAPADIYAGPQRAFFKA